MNRKELKEHLDRLYEQTAHLGFIENDPICLPHIYSKKEDIELAGFFAAIFAWGQRVTIINKTRDVLERMDHSPHDFIVNHQEHDRKKLEGFVHRTFNDTDLIYFVERLQRIYYQDGSLETSFSKHISKKDKTIEPSLVGFRTQFFDHEFPKRTTKHIATPAKNSTCKRLCMYLRWMVRKDAVDFGIWKSISPSQLMMPLDVHVERMARTLNLIKRKQRDWKTVVELTNSLRRLDKYDPVKYDLALFGSAFL